MEQPVPLRSQACQRARALLALRRGGTGTMDPPWWSELDGLATPTTVVAGEQDEKFQALGRRLAATITGPTEVVVVPPAGHACHLEAPDRMAQIIRGAARPGPSR